ncbi:hypothetical protein FKP32DRAFT_493807 [Trametes sanguinea]|nr:hypothetical protein FKP32DRAFT_493807 [Trametes sanguinea]
MTVARSPHGLKTCRADRLVMSQSRRYSRLPQSGTYWRTATDTPSGSDATALSSSAVLLSDVPRGPYFHRKPTNTPRQHLGSRHTAPNLAADELGKNLRRLKVDRTFFSAPSQTAVTSRSPGHADPIRYPSEVSWTAPRSLDLPSFALRPRYSRISR